MALIEVGDDRHHLRLLQPSEHVPIANGARHVLTLLLGASVRNAQCVCGGTVEREACCREREGTMSTAQSRYERRGRRTDKETRFQRINHAWSRTHHDSRRLVCIYCGTTKPRSSK